MGHLIWGHKDIEAVDFVKFPSKPTAMHRIVRTGDGVLYAIAKEGSKRVYTTSQFSKKAAFVPGEWRGLEDCLAALQKLGVVSKEACESHALWCAEVERFKNAQSCREYKVPALAKHGVVLTPEQVKVLDEACKPRKGGK